MSNEVKMGIVGCTGRMGQMLITTIGETEGCIVAGAVDLPDHAAIGQDAGDYAKAGIIGVPITGNLDAMLQQVDVAIDFTIPAATVANAKAAAAAGTAMVIGTTGLDTEQAAAVESAAQNVPIVWAPNMSVGVNLLMGLTEQVAALLGPDDYDIEVLEMHHKHKIDAPSGTALGLGRAAAAGRGVPLESVYQAVRDGQTGARPAGQIGFATLRGGDVVGEHSVIFASDGDRIELTHKASNRRVFAAGAVHAAKWAPKQSPGLYSMKNVLGFD